MFMLLSSPVKNMADRMSTCMPFNNVLSFSCLHISCKVGLNILFFDILNGIFFSTIASNW